VENLVKYLLILLLALFAACATAPAPTDGGATGAASPRAAVDAFMASMKNQDIQATAVVWGTDRGPARDVLPDRSQLERRVMVMQQYLAHDSYAVVGDAASGSGTRIFRLAVTRGGMTRETTMRTVQGPQSRWYVEHVELEPLRDLIRGG
jgi:hypothetical protein